MGISAWLAAMMRPLVARVLMALGFSVVSVTGLNLVIEQLKDMFLAQLMSVSAAGLQLALLSGVGTAAGIIFGAIATRMALWQIQNGAKILGMPGA